MSYMWIFITIDRWQWIWIGIITVCVVTRSRRLIIIIVVIMIIIIIDYIEKNYSVNDQISADIYIPELSTFLVLTKGDNNVGLAFVVDIDGRATEWYLAIWLCKSSIFLS